MDSSSQPPPDSEPQPARPESVPDKSNMDATTDVEIQRRFNELRRELLDHRIKLADRWLTATAGFLTFFGVVAVIIGYLSFQEFSDIETEARQHMEVAEKHAIRAERVVKEIEATHDEAQALLKGMNAEIVRNDPDKASEVVETVQQSPVASPIDRAIAAAILLQQRGEIEQAIEKWRSIANVAEGVDRQLQARAWFSVGYLYGEEDNRKEAINAYNEAIRLKPDMAEAYNNRGVAKNALGQYKSALADFNEAIRLKSDNAEAYNNRGNAKSGLRQYQVALADYTEAIRLKPDMAEAYNNRGVAKNALGQYKSALADFNEAIRLKPNYVNAYNNRGVAKDALGQYEVALADYDKAIRLDPDYANAYNNRGVTKSKLGQHEVALADYDEAIRLDPDYADTYNNRGFAKNALGQYEAALADLNKAIRLKPDYANAYNNRGNTKRSLGHLNEAREDYRKALALAQESGDEYLVAMVKRNLSRLDNGQVP